VSYKEKRHRDFSKWTGAGTTLVCYRQWDLGIVSRNWAFKISFCSFTIGHSLVTAMAFQLERLEEDEKRKKKEGRRREKKEGRRREKKEGRQRGRSNRSSSSTGGRGRGKH
jgi:hypothetical protein